VTENSAQYTEFLCLRANVVHENVINYLRDIDTDQQTGWWVGQLILQSLFDIHQTAPINFACVHSESENDARFFALKTPRPCRRADESACTHAFTQ